MDCKIVMVQLQPHLNQFFPELAFSLESGNSWFENHGLDWRSLTMVLSFQDATGREMLQPFQCFA